MKKSDRTKMIKHRDLGEPSVVWPYRDAFGKIIGYDCRFETPDGKQVLPYTRQKNGKFTWKGFSEPRPLYGLDRLAKNPDAPVIICEGCKAAKAAQKLLPHSVCISWSGGVGSVEKADWRPIAGRAITIWPDADGGGYEAAYKIHQILLKNEVITTLPPILLPPKNVKNGWDAADALNEGWTPESTAEFVKSSAKKPYYFWQEVLPAVNAWRDEQEAKRKHRKDTRKKEKTEKEKVSQTWPYKVIEGRICRLKEDRDAGVISIPLCNFATHITHVDFFDDGMEKKVIFTIEGTLHDGKPLQKIQVPSHRFQGMSWVMENWGSSAVVYAGPAVKDHLRVAIQTFSFDAPEQTIYSHLGWRKIQGDWVYLHAAGGVPGREEVKVDPGDGRLKDYALPKPPEGEELIRAIRASISMLDLAPEKITFPLLAGVYRAPLNEAAPIDFSLFLSGPTGSQKSELSAMAQAHFGPRFHAKNLPGNWSSSDNALEKQAFLAKDALLVIDDFAPAGPMSDVQRLHKKADRLIRAQGNRSGRGRMRTDGSLRPEYFPQGLILSSGEDTPQGQSIRARMLILDISAGEVDLEKLTKAQEDSANGLYTRAISSYVAWLAPQIDSMKGSLPGRHQELRAEIRRKKMDHDRTPDIVASLLLGWETFLRFALEKGVIKEKEKDALWARAREAFLDSARTQSGHLESEEPTERFLGLLGSAISSGQAHVADANTGREPEDGGSWGWREKSGASDSFEDSSRQPQGERIGWLKGADLLLDPESAFATVQKLARNQGTSLPIAQTTLWKRMAEKDRLASKGASRNKARFTIVGTRRWVIHIKAGVLSPKTDPIDPDGSSPEIEAEFRTENLDHFPGKTEKLDLENGPEKQTEPALGPDGPIGPVLGDGSHRYFESDEIGF